uniref:Leucine Rich repeat protein n=1 Tax=Musca domestica TaxID=7370 RepID=A0A1I8N2H8_MUSDO
MYQNNADANGYNANKKELNLSDRNLRELDTAIIATYGECIEHLDLSHNRITRLEWLYQMPNLRCLIMDDNRLRESHFEKLKKVPLPKITTLTLNKNELSDLDTTAEMLQQIFPNLEYLSLHGNPMCPDNLCLQPFSEFVPYEYAHYRDVLSKSLPHLKFLDHFSLDAKQLPKDSHCIKQDKSTQQPIISFSGDLWSKLKNFLSVPNATNSNTGQNENGNRLVSSLAPSYDSTYKGVHSEGNRYITNSDL